MNYETLKAMARKRGVPVTELVALAPKNDPFYSGTPGHREKAEWFAGLWRRFGYTTGVHLRRVHYQLVSQAAPVLLPNGKPYENTQACWNYLCEAGKQARYLGLVDPRAFVDRRNPEPHIHRHDNGWVEGGSWSYDLEEWRFPAVDFAYALDACLARPTADARGYDWVQELQPYLLEVWAEKATVNDILEPVCRRYRANLVTGLGFMSITAVMELLERVRQVGRPCRIFYVSDYDPAGFGMPIAVARQIEYWARGDGLDIALTPLVLTAEQVKRYGLPRVPVKETDRRKRNWEAAHGEGAVELDALEALYPGELARIASEALARYYDPTLEDRAAEQLQALRRAAQQAVEEATEPFEEDLELLEKEIGAVADRYRPQLETLAEQLEALRREMEAELSPLVEEAQRVRRQLWAALEAIDLVPERDFPLPKPRVEGDKEEPFFSTGRSYMEQLAVYRRHRNQSAVHSP